MCVVIVFLFLFFLFIFFNANILIFIIFFLTEARKCVCKSPYVTYAQFGFFQCVHPELHIHRFHIIDDYKCGSRTQNTVLNNDGITGLIYNGPDLNSDVSPHLAAEIT